MARFNFTAKGIEDPLVPEASPSPTPRFDFTGGSSPAAPTAAPAPIGTSRFDFTGGGVAPQTSQSTGYGGNRETTQPASTPVGVPHSGEDEGFSIGGFIENAIGGVAGAIEGIGNIAIGGIQDAAGQVQKLDFIPGLGGEQSLEKRVDQEGSAFVRTLVGPGDAPSIFNALSDDFKYRYGPLFEGDFESFLHRIYNQPVSFLLDAAAVGGAAAAPFKALEKLSVFREVAAGTPYRVAAEAAVAGRTGLTRAVLGPGSEEFASFTSVGGKTVKLPSNPVTRIPKQFFLQAISKPLESAFAEAGTKAPGLGLATEAYKVAKSVGAERVLRPTWSKLAESRMVGLMGGIKRSRLGDIRAEALKELESDYLLGKVAKPGTVAKPGIAEAFQVVENVQGSAPGTELPGYGNLDLHMNDLPEVGPDQIPPVSETSDLQKLADARLLTKEFGGDGVKPANFDAPHSPDATGGRYEVIVASMRQAEDAIKRAATRLGGRVIGVRNYLPEGSEAWNGIHGFVELPDGRIVEISAGTEKLFRAQGAASGIFKARDFHATEAQRYANDVVQLAREGATPAKIAAAEARALFHSHEVEAAQYLGSSMFEGSFRQMYAEANDLPYDSALQVADELRIWSHKWMAQPELDAGFINFQTIVNRAYGPQRLTSFMYDMATLEENLPLLLGQFRHWDEAIPALTDAMIGMPDALISDVLDMDNLRMLNIKDPVSAAKVIADNLRDNLRENIINGDIPEYSWQSMHAARMVENLPMPSYYPHIKISDLPMSDLAKTGKRGWKPAIPANVSHQWMGHLMEEGTVIMDPIEAYTRVFNSISKHHEVIRYLDEVLKTYGRKVSRAEIETMKGVMNNPEVFINGIGAKSEISFRSMLEAKTYEYLRNGETLEKATALAIRDMGTDLTKSAIISETGQIMAIPRHIAKQVSAELAHSIGWKSRVFWDSPMAVWRASVLSFSPRWIFNNTIGNIVFTGIKDPRAVFYSIRQLSKRQRTIMEFLLGPEKMRDIEAGFSHNLPAMYHRFSDEAIAESPKMASAAQRLQNALPSRALRSVASYSRRINSSIEEAFRRGIYLSAAERASVGKFGTSFASSKIALDNLAREGITPATHNAALLKVDATLGNYTNLSPREQDIARRYIAPFYAFYRHVAKYTAKLPFENPLAMKVLQQFGAIDDDMDKYLPEWLREAGIVGTFGQGDEMFLGLQSANPLNSIVNMGEAPLASVNPAIKVVLERLTGKNLFSRKDFTSQDVYEARDGTKWVYQRDDQGRVVGRPQPLGSNYVLPPLWRHIAMQFGPFAPIEKTIAATVGPGLGAQSSATGNVITDHGKPVFPTEPWTIFTNWLGIPFYSFDVEAEKQDYLESQQEALTAAGG